MANVCPECRVGKCGNCGTDAFDEVTDEPTVCDCHASGHTGHHQPPARTPPSWEEQWPEQTPEQLAATPWDGVR